MKVSVGPVTAAEFAVNVELRDKVAPERFTMHIDGKGGVGFTKGTAIDRASEINEEPGACHGDELHIGHAGGRQDRGSRAAPARVGRKDDGEAGARGAEQRELKARLVKPAPFEYHRPRTLDEALSLLAEHGGDAKPLAGGQSLIPAMNFRLATPSVLVDLNCAGRARLHHERLRRPSDRRHDPPARGRAQRARCAEWRRLSPRPCRTSRIRRSASAARSAAAWRTPIRRPSCRP